MNEPYTKQNIYDHGGSRIFMEIKGSRHLIIDTYLEDEKFAIDTKEFVEQWLEKKAQEEDEGSK